MTTFKYTSEQLNTFNKGELREACRAHGINYSSLNNEGMRAALATVSADETVPAVSPEPSVAPEPVVAPPLPEVPVSPEVAVGPGTPPIATVVPRDPFVQPTAPAKAKKERAVRVPQPEQNGVKRPKEGTICAQIWAWCDAQDKAGTRPEAKALRAALPALDDTTKTVQFYRWRKFNGISGR